MGCDIHMQLEAKVDGRWEHVGELEVWRDYELFSCLAECGRNIDQRPIVENRGVPDDANPYTKLELINPDIHSTSWLTEAEFWQAYGLASSLNEQIQASRELHKEALGIFDSKLEVRYVFGFDN
jgi:hypothetical protein